MKYIQGYPVIDDAPAVKTAEFGTGYIERDYQAFPLNGEPFTRAATIQRLSMAEIKELAREKTANKTWLTDLADAKGSKVKNQKNSSYCWIHAPVRLMELARLHAGGAPLTLSAFYAGSQIKNGRNEGGWGLQGIKFLHEHGTCVESMWPPMQFRGTVTDEIKTNAELHQITAFEEFEPQDMELIYSSIVQDQGVTVGIPAWGHEVALTFLVFEGNDLLPGHDNSWGTDYGQNGRGVLKGKMTRFSEAGRIAAMESSVQ